MKKNSALFIYLIAFVFIGHGLTKVAAQEKAGEPQASPMAGNVALEEESAAGENAAAEEKWLWGEIVSVQAANKSIVVKYLDYDTDTEKEITIYLTGTTTFENVKAVEEIKPKDVASIDYIVDNNGKAVAKNISVEKMEGVEIIPEEPQVNQEAPDAAVQEPNPLPQTKQ